MIKKSISTKHLVKMIQFVINYFEFTSNVEHKTSVTATEINFIPTWTTWRKSFIEKTKLAI